MKVAEIKATHNSRVDKGDPWFRFVVRPISFYLAWPCIKLGIKPNHVTIASIVIGVVGCFLLPFHLVLGVIFICLYTLLDSLDGVIARATNSVTKAGSLIDGIGYLIMIGLIFPAVGIRLYLHPESITGVSPTIFLLLGFVATYSRLYRYSIASKVALVLGKKDPVYYQDRPGITGKLFKVGILTIVLRDPILLICAFLNTLSLFILFYALVNTAEFVVVMYKLVKR